MVQFGSNWIKWPGHHEVSLAIAGGGCKAFYALGFGYKLRKWGIKFKAMSGVSAGAAMVMGIISENEEAGLEYAASLTKRNQKNFDLKRLLKGERPFPHENIYRRSIRYSLDIEKIRTTDIKIYIQAVLAFPKEDKLTDLFRKTRLIPQTAHAFLLDEADKLKGKEVYRVNKIIEKWNLKEKIYTNEDLKDPNLIEQIVLNSSSIPPVLSFQAKDNAYYLDGGLLNNLVLEKFPERDKKIGIYYDDTTIIGKNLEGLKNTMLIKPSKELKITTFDYTNPEGLIETYELGKKDAESMKEKIMDFTQVKLTDYLVA
ncbi:MAG: patatin-like phospholipase family protein [Leptospiraceae bacterium]|nr:patatin-like phospholipase family protein [Leptospiraceae bacterium]